MSDTKDGARARQRLARQIRRGASVTKREASPKVRKGSLIPTGSTMLNLALSDRISGGFQLGKVENLIGDSSSGKTMVALTMLAAVANDSRFDNYRLIYDDVEAANEFDVEYLFGSRLSERIEPPEISDEGDMVHSDTVQDAHYHILDALAEERPFIYVLDSLDLLTSKEDQAKVEEQYKAHKKGSDTAGTYALSKPKYVSWMLTDLKKKLKDSRSMVLIISQTRDNINPVSFVKKIRSGGNALKFAACHEVWIAPAAKIKKLDMVVGQVCKVKITKNKITGKNRECEFPIFYDYGIDDIGSCVDFLVKAKAWTKKGLTISTHDDCLKGTRAKLLRMIEEEEREEEIRRAAQKAWDQLESRLKTDRKRRFQ